MTNSLFPKLFLSIMICVGYGAWVSMSTAPQAWFKPLPNPAGMFASVWTTLYTMIGASYALKSHDRLSF